MTANNINQILARLDKIDEELSAMRVEMAETRGAYRLAKFVIGILGLTGISGFMAWLSGQGK
jgi:tetrahydromethanopterin S-methyltransferase subunit G